jgi:ankyrin repeat protein
MAKSNAENHQLITPSPGASSSSGDVSSSKKEALEILRGLLKEPKYKDLLARVFYDSMGQEREIPLLDAVAPQKGSPLQEVIANRNKNFLYPEIEAIIKWLLQAGADIEASNYHSFYDTPFIMAITADPEHAIALMTLLLKLGADINAYSSVYGCNSLGAAILRPRSPWRLAIIEFLLDNKADQEKCFSNVAFSSRNFYINALARTAMLGDYQVASLLLKHNADVNVMTADSSTPLYYAVECGRVAIVNLLLNAGADFDATPNRGMIAMPPLTYASERNYYPIVILLLEAGANPNETNESERPTPLLVACSHQHWSIAVRLLQHGANPNVVTRSTGLTPLHYSVYSDNLEVSQLLLEHGANPVLRSLRCYDKDLSKKTPRELVNGENKTLMDLLLSAESTYSDAVAHDSAPPAKRHCRR